VAKENDLSTTIANGKTLMPEKCFLTLDYDAVIDQAHSVATWLTS
jgi:hypothetical protein